MKKAASKKVVKGKNKFIRLETDNLKFVVKKSKELDRSQNYVINFLISSARIRENAGSYSK